MTPKTTQMKFSQEDFIFIYFSPCSHYSSDHGQTPSPFHSLDSAMNTIHHSTLCCQLTFQAYVRSSSNSSSSCSSHPVLLTRINSHVVRSPGSFFLHHHHQCLDSIGGFRFYAQLHPLPKILPHHDGV